jgi:predicted  nucleic acid-binding Zn-ribbon protein
VKISTLDEIEKTLESLLVNTMFLHKEIREDTHENAYWLQLFEPTQVFLNEILKKTQEILHENMTFQTINEMEDLLFLHGFSFKDLYPLYPQTKTNSLKEQSIRKIISSLAKLHYLKNNGLEAYAIDISFLKEFENIEMQLELNRVFQPILNHENINNIDVHGVFWLSPRKLPMKKPKLDLTWKKENNSWVKVFQIPNGTLRFVAYSNKENPDFHPLHIYYEGSLLIKNENKRKERNKFAVNTNDLSKLNDYITLRFYDLQMDGTFDFKPEEFNGFLVKSLGLNVDTDLSNVPYPSITFQKEVSMRDLVNNYTLRFYKYPTALGEKLRIETHIDNPTNFSIKGSIDALSFFSNGILNPNIENHKKDTYAYHNSKEIKDVSHRLDSLSVSIERKVNDLHSENLLTLKTNNDNAFAITDLFGKSMSSLTTKMDSLENEIQQTTKSINTTQSTNLIQVVSDKFQSLSQSMTNFESEFDQIAEKIDQLGEKDQDQTEVIESLKDNVIQITDLCASLRQDQQSFKNNMENVIERLDHHNSIVSTTLNETLKLNENIRKDISHVENQILETNLRNNRLENVLTQFIEMQLEQKKGFFQRRREKKQKNQ